MDIENAKVILQGIENKKIKIEETHTSIPSPFAFNLVIMGYTDIMKIDDKIEFLRRMHQSIIAKVYLKKGKEKKEKKDFDYHSEWEEAQKRKEQEKDEFKEHLKKLIGEQKRVPAYAKLEIMRLIDGDEDIRQDVINGLEQRKQEIKRSWPEELSTFVFKRLKKLG